MIESFFQSPVSLTLAVIAIVYAAGVVWLFRSHGTSSTVYRHFMNINREFEARAEKRRRVSKSSS